MRIAISADDRFNDQTRAYAEYRVFSSLARFGRDAGNPVIALARSRDRDGDVVCTVTLTMACGTRVRVSALARHACDAIDRAAGRASELLRRRRRTALTG